MSLTAAVDTDTRRNKSMPSGINGTTRSARPLAYTAVVLLLSACVGRTSTLQAVDPIAAAADSRILVAVTIDDLPFQGTVGPGDSPAAATARVLAALKTHGAPATGFVRCGKPPLAIALLSQWRVAGFDLGNHSTSHQPIDSMTPQQWRDDLIACGESLGVAFGASPTYYRFPFLQSGGTAERRDAAAAELARLGLRTAPVSIDTSDWLLRIAYEKALQAHDAATADAIGDAYVAHVRAALAHYRQVAEGRVGRDVRHVLLLHHHVLAADHLGAVLEALTQDGVTFISLAAALSDPVYARRDDYAGRIGMSWLYHLAPADEPAWAWDHGQMLALASHFGVAGMGLRDDGPSRIDFDLTVYPLSPRALVVTHTESSAGDSLVAETAHGIVVLVGAPYAAPVTQRLVTWIQARFGPRPVIAVNPHFSDDGTVERATLGTDLAAWRGRIARLRDYAVIWLVPGKGENTVPDDLIAQTVAALDGAGGVSDTAGHPRAR